MVTYRYNRKLAIYSPENIACLVKKCDIGEKFVKVSFYGSIVKKLRKIF